jgi:hypothetical protein
MSPAQSIDPHDHGAQGHPIPKLHEFTVDASISPLQVLCRHPQDQAP